MVLLDHRKNYYVKDLETLSQQGLLTPNHWVIADNIFSPGCPEYFAFMKANPAYKSILYHSYNNTNDEADGVLISQHL
jgi:catechol O-methyltransferase